MTQLGQEELDILVRELAQLVAEDEVNAYVVGIAAAKGEERPLAGRRREKARARVTWEVNAREV